MSKHLAESFDVLLMGDMFFDETLGIELSNLAKLFLGHSSGKTVLVGDPGRWFLSEKKLEPPGLQCVAKYDLPPDVQAEHYGLVSGFVYNILPT